MNNSTIEKRLVFRGRMQMEKSDDTRCLVLIPCYNEQMTIGSVVLKTKRHIDTVVVVDDGSSDSTAEIAREAGAIVLSHPKNKGKSAAIKTGFKYALENGFDYVITIDGDGQHNPDEIPVLLTEMQNNSHDILIGTRFGPSTEMPAWRKIGKRVLDYATSFGAGGHLTDSQSGFRGFNKKAVEHLASRLDGGGFSVESEQLIKAHDAGLQIGNTRVACKYNGLETSTKNPTSHGMSVLSYVIWMVAEKRPLLFIGVPGFVLVLLGIFIGILTLQVYNKTHVFPISYAILVSIFLIVGVLAMFIGLMLNVLPNILKRIQQKEN
jgi:glycosyltransferase involved in cell wall biosynthesis